MTYLQNSCRCLPFGCQVSSLAAVSINLFQIVALALTLSCGISTRAAEERSLFNGHSLEGWSGDEKVWSVRDGQIVGSTVDHPIDANTFLVWQGGNVSDFRLTCQVRLEGNNSGVQYRSKLIDPETWRMAGYQADMHPKPEYIGMLYSEGTGRGIIAERGQRVVVSAEAGKPEITGQTSPATPLDLTKWHEYTIVAQGNRLIHKIDGKVTVDVTDNHKEKASTGLLGLQVHAGPPMTVYFKDIVLQTLTGEVPTNQAQQMNQP